MSNIECALEILKSKGYIEMDRIWKAKPELNPERKLIVKNGYERLFRKIDAALLDSECHKHMIYSRNGLRIHFFEVDELQKWLDDTCSRREKTKMTVGIPEYMKVWINNCTEYFVEDEMDCGISMDFIINEKIEKQRLEKERADEDEAIKLLEKIL